MKWLQPQALYDTMDKALPWLATFATLLLGSGLWLALGNSPPDYLQGEMVRVMYIHVPSAWLALALYMAMALASTVFLIWRLAIGDLLARAIAPVGAVTCAVTLITGSLWGKPTWGTWWVWDARLTSMFILMLCYLGYVMFARSSLDNEQGAKARAVLAVIGAINIPIIKFSVEIWHSLHQPASLLRRGGSAIHPDMLLPLLLMAVALAVYVLTMIMLQFKSLYLEQKLRRKLMRAQ
jgi:heme exporter protein C